MFPLLIPALGFLLGASTEVLAVGATEALAVGATEAAVAGATEAAVATAARQAAVRQTGKAVARKAARSATDGGSRGRQVVVAGPWRMPLAPTRVARRYDPPNLKWERGHRGVDLTAEPGQEVTAPAAGRISHSGVVAGRRTVTVDHGQIRTTYEPVRGRLPVGTRVRPGDVIGTVDGTHLPCGSCVHWGARVGDGYVDPLTFVRGRPVLLPHGGSPTRGG